MLEELVKNQQDTLNSNNYKIGIQLNMFFIFISSYRICMTAVYWEGQVKLPKSQY